MLANSLKEKPKIQSPLMLGGDQQLTDVLRQINDWHGIGVVTQTDSGGTVPIRVHTASGTPKLQACVDGKWVDAGSLAPDAAAAVTRTATTIASELDHLSVLGDISVGGLVDGVDVSSIPTSYLPIHGTADNATLFSGHDPTCFSLATHNHDSAYLGIHATADNSALLNGHADSYFATTTHLHTGVYLPLTGQAADSDKLDGLDASAFLLVGGTAMNATQWAGHNFTDYLNQALLTTSAPVFSGLNVGTSTKPNMIYVDTVNGRVGLGVVPYYNALEVGGDTTIRMNRGTLAASVVNGSGVMEVYPDTGRAFRFNLSVNSRFGDAADDFFFQLNMGSVSTSWAMFEAYQGAGLTIGTGGAANPVVFLINRAEKMRLDQNGRLGIGVSVPNYLLDVAGDINTNTVHRVAGVQVVGARQGAIANATNSTDVITQFNVLLAACRAHGLIGP